MATELDMMCWIMLKLNFSASQVFQMTPKELEYWFKEAKRCE